MLAGGAGASGSVQAPPQASHHFCPAPWVGMGCRGRQEGAPDLARGVHLASPRRRDRRCQGWQALRREHSQGVINNLLSQGGLLGFRITRHRRRAAQMDPLPFLLFTLTGTTVKLGGGCSRSRAPSGLAGQLGPILDGHCTQRGHRARTGAATSPKYESCHKGIKQGGLGQRHTALISYVRM